MSFTKHVATDKSAWRDKDRRWRAHVFDHDGLERAEGFGRTATEAKEDMFRSIMRSLRWAGAAPKVVAALDGRLAALVYASEGSWHYRILRDGAPAGQCGAWDGPRDAEIHARRHLAQLAFDDEAVRDGTDVIHPDDIDGRYEHARWVTWQRAYAEAKAEGLDDEACRERADKA